MTPPNLTVKIGGQINRTKLTLHNKGHCDRNMPQSRFMSAMKPRLGEGSNWKLQSNQ